MSPDVNLETVRTYLRGCDPDLACEIVGILQHSLTYGKDQSATYIVKQCEKCDPNSPIAQLLKKDKNYWPQVMTISDEVAEERKLNVERLYG